MIKQIVKITALLTIPVLFVSCEKESVLSEDGVTAEDIALSEAIMTDADDQAAFKSDPTAEVGDFGVSGDCPVLTWENEVGTFPNTLTIDYGEGCDCRGGHSKSGQIVVEMSDEIMNEGAVRTITLVDFQVNGNDVEGTRSVSNTGTNESGQPVFSVIGSHTANFSDGNSASLNVAHVRTMVAGYDTEDREDDAFSVTGSETGVNRRGDTFTGTILSPLFRSRECKWVTEGVHQVETSDGRSRTIDFGDGTCDDQAELTLSNGTTRTIRLRRH